MMQSKQLRKLGGMFLASMVGLAASFATVRIPLSAQDFCEIPQVISFDSAVFAQGNAFLKGNSFVDGLVHSNTYVETEGNVQVSDNITSNGNVKLGSINNIGGNVTANGTIELGLLTTVTGSINELAGSQNKALPNLNLTGWKSVATNGGDIIGGLNVPANSSQNIGPTQVSGNLVLNENSILTLDGPIYITGNLIINGNGKINLSNNFVGSGTLIIVDGDIDLGGNAKVDGQNPSAPILLVSTGGDIELGGNFNTNAAVFFTNQGTITVGDGGNAKIIAAYGQEVVVNNNAQVLHEPGLIDANFSCPPPTGNTTFDVDIIKTADQTSVTLGQQFSYTITVTNNGTIDATNVEVTDNLPNEIDYISSVASAGTYDSATGIWSVGSITAGSNATLTILVEARTTGTITNLAIISNAEGGQDPDQDDQSSIDVTISNGSGGSGNNGGGGGGSGSRRGSISGLIYSDLNRNGIYESESDQAIPSIIVYLDENNNSQRDNNEANTSSNSNGEYDFNNLSPNTYNVRIITPSGYQISGPPSGSYQVEVERGSETGYDFGLYRPGQVLGETDPPAPDGAINQQTTRLPRTGLSFQWLLILLLLALPAKVIVSKNS